MSYNDKLKSDILVAKVSISALEKERKTVAETSDAYRITLRQKFRQLIDKYNAEFNFIPAKMLETIEFHISDSIIRPRWIAYDKEGYHRDLDIYYYSDKHYDNRNSGNHRWEISCSSMRLYVNTAAEKQLPFNEEQDRTLLALGMSHFIRDNKESLIELHQEFLENDNRVYTISSAIKKLNRDITDAERQMETNDLIRIVKPGGETAIYAFGKEIKMFTKNNTYYYTNRRCCHFEAIRLVKETKKGVKVDFLNYSRDNDGNITGNWTTETKVLTFTDLIGVLRDSKREFEKQEKRRIEKEKESNNVAA